MSPWVVVVTFRENAMTIHGPFVCVTEAIACETEWNAIFQSRGLKDMEALARMLNEATGVVRDRLWEGVDGAH